MNKPTGYDEARESGTFTPVELGGHYAIIKQVTEKQTSTNKPMIVVLFDFAPEDKQPGYFVDSFESDLREDKKWPFAGSKYIMVQDYQDASKTSRQFKTFCSCIEKSNGMTIKWGGSDWGKQFKGKKIGVIYGEEEHEYDGETSMRRLPKFFCTVDRVATATVPPAKYLVRDASATPTKTIEGVTVIPDDEIPF